MAIQDSFNLAHALDSQSYAYNCWYNYNYGNNTMGIKAKDIGEITQKWKDEVNNWHATASDDENAYIIDDEDFNSAKKVGRSIGHEAYGDNRKNTNKAKGTGANKTSVAGDFIVSAGGAAATGASILFGQKAGIGITQKVVGKTAEKTIENTASQAAMKEATVKVTEKGSDVVLNKTAENGVKHSGKAAKVSAYIAAGIAIATATKYWIAKPNKDEKEACDNLQDKMNDATQALDAAQADMKRMKVDIEAISEDAQEENENANESIKEDKTEYDVYKQTYETLSSKVARGEALEDHEKALMQEIVPLMNTLGISIQDTKEKNTEFTSEAFDTMETFQEGYDNAAATTGEVEGLTDFAENLDTPTRRMCYVEAASQTMNAASGATAGAKLMAGMPWQWALGIASMAAGASSGGAAMQQMSWAGKVGTEIEMREAVQDYNLITTSEYDENISVYEGQMGTVETLEVDMPKELENVDEVNDELTQKSTETLSKNEQLEKKDNDNSLGNKPQPNLQLGNTVKAKNTTIQANQISAQNNPAQTKNKKNTRNKKNNINQRTQNNNAKIQQHPNNQDRNNVNNNNKSRNVNNNTQNKDDKKIKKDKETK